MHIHPFIIFFTKLEFNKNYTFKDIEEPSEKFFWPEVPVEDDADEESIKEPEEQDNMSITEQLQLVHIYLRRTYNYCVYCGTVYDDEQDLEGECPGPNRQDH